MIDKAIEEGAKLLIDGRDLKLAGFENGFFLGPTLLDNVTPNMVTYHEEIFGPVLQIMRVNSLEDAI